MMTQAKILGVEMRKHLDKKTRNHVDVADVMLQYSNPTELVVITLWNHSVAKDEHKPYAALAGQDCIVAVKTRVFNGLQTYELNTSVLPQAVKPLAVAKSA